jgi:hypothetical protein
MTVYKPSPGVMYTPAVPDAVMPVTYILGTNESISSVLAMMGILIALFAPPPVGIVALVVASAEVAANPRWTVTLPALITRYWLPPRLEDAT